MSAPVSQVWEGIFLKETEPGKIQETETGKIRLDSDEMGLRKIGLNAQGLFPTEKLFIRTTAYLASTLNGTCTVRLPDRAFGGDLCLMPSVMPHADRPLSWRALAFARSHRPGRFCRVLSIAPDEGIT